MGTFAVERTKLGWVVSLTLQALLALTVGALAAILSGCTGSTRPDPPPLQPGAVHTVTETVRYVPIDAALTRPCAPDLVVVTPAQVFDVLAAERRAKAECSARLVEIGRIQGTKP